MGVLQEIQSNIDSLITEMDRYVNKFDAPGGNKYTERKAFLRKMKTANDKLNDFSHQTNTGATGATSLAAGAASLASSGKERVHLLWAVRLKINVKGIESRAATVKEYTQNSKNNKGDGWNRSMFKLGQQGHAQFLSAQIEKINQLVTGLQKTDKDVERARRARGCTEQKYSEEESAGAVAWVQKNQSRRRQRQRSPIHQQRQSGPCRNDERQTLIDRSRGSQKTSCLPSCLSSCLSGLFSNNASSTTGYRRMRDVASEATDYSGNDNLW